MAPDGGGEVRLRSAPVGQYSRQEVAARAGVDPDYVDRLVELGIDRASCDIEIAASGGSPGRVA